MKWFKKLIKAIFGSKDSASPSNPIGPVIVSPGETIPEVPTKEEVENFPTSGIKKIAILIGHGAGDSGAIAWNKMQEHEYNKKVAELIKDKTNKEIKVFYKSSSGWAPTYLKIASFAPDLSMELHLNATEGAQGCEVLCIEGDEKSAVFGRNFAASFCAKFSRKLRREKGILWLSSGDRGYGNVKSMKIVAKKGAILVEPFFCDTKSEWIEPDIYSNFLIEWINKL